MKSLEGGNRALRATGLVVAVDTQLGVPFRPDSDGTISLLFQCLPESETWTKAIWLSVNPDKAEVMLFSRGKALEELEKTMPAPSIERVPQLLSPWLGIRFSPAPAHPRSVAFLLDLPKKAHPCGLAVTLAHLFLPLTLHG